MLSMNQIIGELEEWVDSVHSALKTVLFLDEDKVFLKTIKYKCRAHDDELVTISNIEEFQAFTHSPDRKIISKLFIDINLPSETGIDLAKQMELDKNGTQLFFVSNIEPTEDQKTQIIDLGGKFLLKKDLLKTVIFPKEEQKD